MRSNSILQYLTKQLKSNVPNTFPFGIQEFLFILDVWLTNNNEGNQLTIIRSNNGTIFVGIGKNFINSDNPPNEKIPIFVNIPFGINQKIQEYHCDLTFIIHENIIELFTNNTNNTLLELLNLDINDINKNIPNIQNTDYFSLDKCFLTLSNNSSFIFCPTYNEFIDCMKNAYNAFNNNTFEKIVLSRTISFDINSYKLNNLVIFLLKQEFNIKNNSNYFYLSLDKQELFVSFTPESLIKVNNNSLYTEALAGSSPIIKDATLAQDKKNLNENNIVVNYIKNKLIKLNIVPKVHETKLKELNYITHLITPITANIDEYSHNTIQKIINCLHPTPATLGFPSKNAIDFIQKYNNYPKYQYASSCGVIFNTHTHILVLLRASFIKGNKITLFGGAGIMPSSDTEKEWNEMGVKMSAIIQKLPFLNKKMLYEMLREK